MKDLRRLGSAARERRARIEREIPGSAAVLLLGALTLLQAFGQGPAGAGAAVPGADLIREIAASGSRFQQELERYTYRQKFDFFELEKDGSPRGYYHETREVFFAPDGRRAEEFVGSPTTNLKRMQLTDEDFRDLWEVQPFVLTAETLWLYDVVFKGEESIDGYDCHVFRIKPRQVLEGQRFLDGMLWISKKHRQVVRVSGRPLPQIHSMSGDNLFPYFSTMYAPVDGKFWFPVKTEAADTLAFSTGLQRVRYSIEFGNYKRFSAETTIEFEEQIR